LERREISREKVEKMITRELVKAEIDKVQDQYLEILYRIIKVLTTPPESVTTPPPSNEEPGTLGWPPNFFQETAGAWQGAPLVREEQGDYEVRDELQ
jgi:hypothetical protein